MGGKDKGRRFLVVGFREVAGRKTGDEVWESDLETAGANVEALVIGGHLMEMKPEDRPTGRRTARRELADGGDE